MNHLDELKKVHCLRGATYSTHEVIDLIGWAAAEIDRLRTKLKNATDEISNLRYQGATE